MARWPARRIDDDRGMVASYVAIMAAPLLLVTGLVVDGGGKIATYMEASNLASSAARAGAQAVDEATLYTTGDVVVDPDLAQDLAEEYLLAAGGVTDFHVEVDGNVVTVTVTLTHDPLMLGGPQEVTSDASATAVRGVETGG
jgi:hypothetical protein